MKKALELIKQVLRTFKVSILKTAKAWVALGVTWGVLQLASKGIIIPEDVSDALTFAVIGVITALFVFFIPNRQ